MRIGTSGWVYRHWRGRFYPEKLPAANWFAFYARHFDTVELNNSFYRQPSRKTFESWRAHSPLDFRFAVKLNRYLTHYKRLNLSAGSIALSYDTMAGLGPKLAVALAQLPPRMGFDAARLETFLRAVARRRRRHAIEPRDASWLGDEPLAALRRRNVALCIIDTPRWPSRLAVTADFVYVRFHGPRGLYASNYPEEELRLWADRMRAWRDQELDVFAYFNNDANAYAVFNAMRLRELVG
ncbi:MAG TPA: DUF72 domain-containing protein [Candidatus Limnocylindria bacterium]|nr:DUF72 domain-containing protein [Candidatus Limnocylindria bacterium]